MFGVAEILAVAWWSVTGSGLPDQGWASIYGQIRPRVYVVRCGMRKGVGFLFGDNYHIVSSLQVAGCGRKVRIQRAPEDQGALDGELEAYIAKHDIALIRVDYPLEGQPLQPSPDDDIRVGMPVALFGHPNPAENLVQQLTRDVLSWSMSAGVIGRITGVYLQVNMPLMVGFFGGPLVDKQGRLLGVMTTLGPRDKPIGVITKASVLTQLPTIKPKPPVREGWPFFAFEFYVHSRFSFALVKGEKEVPLFTQEFRFDLIFRDQWVFGITSGFGLLTEKPGVSLSLGFDLLFRFLMPLRIRPALNYIGVGIGLMGIGFDVFYSGDVASPIGARDNVAPLLWTGLRLYSLVGQFSLGIMLDTRDLTDPQKAQNVLISFSWGLSV